jgi:MFS family permease
MPTASPSPSSVLETVVSKVKWRVLPLFIVMFVVNYIDRVNISFIQQHLRTDLGLDSQAYGFGAGLFFIGYAFFEVPANLALERFGARSWLALIALVWGVMAAATALVQTPAQFFVMRFLLGAAEAGFFPGVVYYFTRWLPAAHRGRAMALFLSGSAIGAIISGPLSGWLLTFGGERLAGWRVMLLLEGAFSVAVAGFARWWLDSLPADAAWLSAQEQGALEAAIAADRAAAAAPPDGRRATAWRLLADPQIVLFCVIYFAVQLTIYAATFWLPKIIRAMGDLDDFQVGLLNSLPWLVSIAGVYLAAAGAARFRHQQAWVAGALVVAGLGMFLATTGGPTVSFLAICFAALGFKSAAALFWPIPQGYLDPRIAAAAIALVNSVGNLGGFVAPATFGWLEQHTGSIEGGLHGLAVTSLVAAGLVFLARTRPRPVADRPAGDQPDPRPTPA